MMEQNIAMMGGDPFNVNNGALDQLNKNNYSYGMFKN